MLGKDPKKQSELFRPMLVDFINNGFQICTPKPGIQAIPFGLW
jgi:hypothetical protein